MNIELIFASLVNTCMKQEHQENNIKECIANGMEDYPLDSIKQLTHLLEKFKIKCVSKKDKSGKKCTSCNGILNLPQNKLQQIETSCEEKENNGSKLETYVEQKQFYYKKRK